jgi:hypothetical protein
MNENNNLHNGGGNIPHRGGLLEYSHHTSQKRPTDPPRYFDLVERRVATDLKFLDI